MNIENLVNLSHEMAVAKGWYDGPARSVPELLCLVHSEISEALECYRNREPNYHESANGKPEGLTVELADAVIRIADMCGFLGLDLETAIERKMAYNSTRPNRHGGKAA